MITCGITMGDPLGIGPEVILKSLNRQQIRCLANFIIIGNAAVLEKTARFNKIGLPIDEIKRDAASPGLKPKKITLLNISNASESAALDYLKAALGLIRAKKIDALITAPVNKHSISKTGNIFKGHTEYLAQATRTKKFAMMLLGGPLKITLVTRHLALKEVSRLLTSKQVYQTIVLTAQALNRYFSIKQPLIGVCALNPHAGEEGSLGDEENKIIRPALAQAKRFVNLAGPLPADSLFYSALQGKFDAVVAMYHDQGLIPLKMLAFHQSVNLTLGLPLVRTAPGHGTAYALAGKGRANPGSMMEAIKLAVKIALKTKD